MFKKILSFSIVAAVAFTSCKDNENTSSTVEIKTTDTVVKKEVVTNTVTNTKTVVVTPEPKVVTSFKTKYPKAENVSWVRYHELPEFYDWSWEPNITWDTTYYVANFKQNDQDVYAFYTPTGEYVTSAYDMAEGTELPAPVKKVLNEKYADFQIRKIKNVNKNNKDAYLIKLDKAGTKEEMKVIITPTGEVLKSKDKSN